MFDISDVLPLFDDWDRWLAVIDFAGGKNAFVGGGAIRDVLLKKPVCDLDIFYEGPVDMHVVKHMLNLEHLPELSFRPLVCLKIEGLENKTLQYDNQVVDSWDVEAPSGLVNLIQVLDSKIRRQSFSSTISMVYYYDRKLSFDVRFLKAVEKKHIDFCKDVDPLYVDKIKAKFSEKEGWSYRDYK
jgi:hypothetical protein